MKTLKAIWRRITTTRTARALEEEILPHMRAQEAEVTRQRAEIARKGAEIDRQHAEIDRLRAENRALLNSILGVAGLPPIIVAAPPTVPGPSAASSGHGFSRADDGVTPVGALAPEAPAAKAADTGGSSTARLKARPDGAARHARLATPLRRRSWQQIHRALEFAALQKREPHEDPLP